MTAPENVMLPNAEQRRQIFHLLKRLSSFTAWQRILDLYRDWLDVADRSVRRASELGLSDATSIREHDLAWIVKGFADLDDAVNRLRHGDRRIFNYSSYSELTRARKPLSFELQSIWRGIDGDIKINYDTTPDWDEYAQSIFRLESAWAECSPDIVQQYYNGKPAEDSPTVFGVWLLGWLPKMTFPDPLPEVPDPIDNILIRTGRTIPCSGIWEPVDAPPAKPTISLFKPRPSPPKGPFRLIGSMSYLHGGMCAPLACQETEDCNPTVAATWRLLWRDDRYLDGRVPEEEQHYVFLYPDPTANPATRPVPFTPSGYYVNGSVSAVETGQRAPRAGRWLVEDDLHASIVVAEGEELPDYQGRKVRWLLAFD